MQDIWKILTISSIKFHSDLNFSTLVIIFYQLHIPKKRNNISEKFSIMWLNYFENYQLFLYDELIAALEKIKTNINLHC